jgi:nickel/cobalt transporter (NiCoT) family protein
MTDTWSFILISIPVMIIFGMRHGLDVDHITAIDNLVRLHNATKKSRLVGAGFSSGHMISVLAEMIFIIYVVGSLITTNNLQFWGGIVGAVALGVIGGINIYAMKKWGKSGSAILASKVLSRTGMFGPIGSALVTGLVFGLGFDTATQISAITLSAVASAMTGIQTALILSGFFALGMVPVDTLDSIVLRSVFSRIFDTKGFRYMAYSLSGVALLIASFESYSTITKTDLFPEWAGLVLAVIIMAVSFGYAFATRKRQRLHHQHDTIMPGHEENKL